MSIKSTIPSDSPSQLQIATYSSKQTRASQPPHIRRQNPQPRGGRTADRVGRIRIHLAQPPLRGVLQLLDLEQVFVHHASRRENAVSWLVTESSRPSLPSSVCRRARRIASATCDGSSTRSLQPPRSRARLA